MSCEYSLYSGGLFCHTCSWLFGKNRIENKNMSIFKFLGVLSPLQINIFTALKRKERVGMDQYGNVYYRGGTRHDGSGRERRWVMYSASPEASNVPPEWHGWLHYQTDTEPDDNTLSFRRPWQKPHKPNMTGTNGAYRPSGHLLSGGKREKATGDYEAWQPPQ
jgi:NADH:ubiquinone oxidoreductase subunit